MPPDEDPVGSAEALIAEGRGREAATHLQSVLAGGRGGLLLRVTLVRALIASDDIESALAAARETALTNPQAAIAAASLGETLLAAGTLATAIGELHRALRLDPQSTQARFLLGNAWLAAGEAEKALEAFEAIAEEDAPPDLAAKISEAHAMRVRARSDPRYVRHLFDEFSATYDTRMLEQLSYNAPVILRQLAGMLAVDERDNYAILDLGCGTGLTGEAFKDIAARLDGIDLSPAMIEKALARGIYDVLMVGDLEEELAGRVANASDSRVPRPPPPRSAVPLHHASRGGGKRSGMRNRFPPPRAGEVSNERSEGDGGGSLSATYDLIVAADTLVYLGELRTVFAGVAGRLLEGGFFLFTVEKSGSAGFELGPKRRWRHSEAYLRDEASRAGLEVAGMLACQPRSEAGVPVAGLAVALASRL